MKRKKQLAVLLAAAFCIAPLSFSAQAESVLVGYRGDVDGNGSVTIADAVLLSQHLLNQKQLDAARSLYGDLDGDGVIDGFDLALLKSICLGLRDPAGIYEEVSDSYLAGSMDVIGASLMTQGTAKVVVFSVEFPDCTFGSPMTEAQIAEICFGAEDRSVSSYPMDTVAAYFDRASNGALNITGDVFTYTAQNSISVYNEDRGALVKEAYDYFSSTVDFTQYDGDGDGVIDATILGVPESADDDYWWPCAGGFDTTYRVDGMQVGNICTGYSVPANRFDYVSSWVHELGHCMGLPDYYRYDQEDFDGMHGDAGVCCMDNAYGDYCALSKLLCGWYYEEDVQIYTGGTQTFTLDSAQAGGGCIVIRRNSSDTDWFGEYFILEYATNEGNNTNAFWTSTGGLRILHAQAEIVSTWWGATFNYCTGGPGDSTDGIHMIRLVNDGDGFFTAGSTVSASTSGFGWYDESGQETVDPGVTVTVNSMENGTCTVTISD